jgi:ATP-dependent RNA helicase DeaD
MTGTDLSDLVGPALASALASRGYDTLTAVQSAVLDPALEGRDLRITSQTGSGKTIAIGFAVRSLVERTEPAEPGTVARPRVLVLAPTRELAKQVSAELSWLFAPMRVRVAAITGGSGFADERRALSANPAVLVATPGRLRDAFERGRIDSGDLAAVALDEADSMLDLGFREDLDAILARLPERRRSHLVSATFSRDVVALADRFQHDPVHVEGTRLGEANADIEHVVHLVEPSQRVDALVNLLLFDEDARSLVFVRTRADVSRIAGELAEAGFVVRTLSGEMEQPERDRALAAFRAGGVQALVATDVAARGIDVHDIARVIQIEPPTDVETYTHRSGRTGRAGRRGTSVLFVSPSHYPAIARGLARAKIAHRVEPVPAPAAIEKARTERLVASLAHPEEGEAIDPHAREIAERVVAGADPVNAVARLIERGGLRGPTRPRDVRSAAPPRDVRSGRDARATPAREVRAPSREGRPARTPGPLAGDDGWVTFRVTWGGRQGADARRLLAMVCRRGDIQGRDVGAIRVEAAHSCIDVAAAVAERFETQVAEPDPRNPLVHIARERARPGDAPEVRRAPRTVPPPGPPPPRASPHSPRSPAHPPRSSSHAPREPRPVSRESHAERSPAHRERPAHPVRPSAQRGAQRPVAQPPAHRRRRES